MNKTELAQQVLGPVQTEVARSAVVVPVPITHVTVMSAMTAVRRVDR